MIWNLKASVSNNIVLQQIIRDMPSFDSKVLSLGTKAMLASKDDIQSNISAHNYPKDFEVVQEFAQHPSKAIGKKRSGAPPYQSS